MKWHARIIRELIYIVREALAELREHNNEYHHHTDGAKLASWEHYVNRLEGEL